MFPGCLQDFSRMFSGCSDGSYWPGGIWWSFQMKVWTLKIQRNPMIPNYSMIPAAAIRWSPAIRWSIKSMDFDNWKVYGDTSITDGLVLTSMYFKTSTKKTFGTASSLPTKMALKILINNGSFLPNSQKQAINSTPMSTYPGLTASWSCLTWRLPSLKWRTAMLLMFFKQGALLLAKLAVGVLIMVFLFILSKMANRLFHKYTFLEIHMEPFWSFFLDPYLIFVIFFTRARFLENKIYTEKRQFFALNL